MVRAVERILGKLQRMAKQGLGILLLAAFLAVLTNMVRPRALPLFAPPAWSRANDFEQPKIALEEAERRYLLKQAVFIDARPPELYAASHIRGAQNLPENAGDAILKRSLVELAGAPMLIVYCDDETSDASLSLCRKLAALDGTVTSRVLLRGWDLWVAGELPIEGGSGVLKGEAER